MSRLIDEWNEKKYTFANPARADEWLIHQISRLDERLDSVEKALGNLLDSQEKEPTP